MESDSPIPRWRERIVRNRPNHRCPQARRRLSAQCLIDAFPHVGYDCGDFTARRIGKVRWDWVRVATPPHDVRKVDGG